MAEERRYGMDDISLAIGELRSESKAGNVQRTELFKQVGDIKDDISDVKQLLLTHNTRVTSMLEANTQKIDVVERDVTTLKVFRTNVWLLLAGITGTGGVTGYLLTKLGLKI